MKLTEVQFDKLCKMNKSYYFDQNNIEEFKQFEIQLNYFINANHFIREFLADISRPIDEDSQVLEYIPTQIMSEYIWSKGYDGFLFDSSVNINSTNIVLFEEKYQYKEHGHYKIVDINLTLRKID
jgi:hypothetical protein